MRTEFIPLDDIPQPAPEPYSVSDVVRIYIGPDDPDSRYHGMRCKVTEVLVDNLDSQTGRPLDAYSYTLQAEESGDELPISFRHRDLVPVK